MNTHIEEKILYLRRMYRRVMAGVLALAVLMVVIDLLYPDLTSLSKKAALISKSVMIVLFLSIIPLLLSHFRKRLGEIPGEADTNWKMGVYQRQFYIKAAVLSALCVLSMVVFIISGDPMILVLLLAGVLFLYFERPNRLRIVDDLGLDEEA
ncbi:MAG: hypothetical protein KGY60_07255 [Bacteroidales bacterium]|nr:hypothetical protein [Bacteroidales bacterium]